jgi:hypothetical protein
MRPRAREEMLVVGVVWPLWRHRTCGRREPVLQLKDIKKSKDDCGQDSVALRLADISTPFAASEHWKERVCIAQARVGCENGAVA